ncbi:MULTISPECIES: hypothetical protein [unclassified Lactococcus]|uniref:hypothetical protein n=1 Tax=unclassified Lactococcus TaxID=2643510 RepID=UPI0011CCA37A|nr:MULTISPECIES: hypothetical protein [unclassified Lactococcus]MQW23731.1 hypothetical protein [Lactococcus sp. dk101]TXK37474.1 hypothetical protein FVP42_08910 [Lactococcus sp. dk310]TXK48817.1 hypothetical protein FVP43_08885 [Lactococcus sp. dk322]
MEKGKVTLKVELENGDVLAKGLEKIITKSNELKLSVDELLGTELKLSVNPVATDKKVRIVTGEMFFDTILKLAEENKLSYRELNNYLERSIHYLDRHQGQVKVKK